MEVCRIVELFVSTMYKLYLIYVNYITTTEVVNCISKYKHTVIKDAPKSKTDLLCYFGKDTDLNISFAKKTDGKYVISKGIASCKSKNYLLSSEWDELAQTQLYNIKVDKSKDILDTFIIESGTVYIFLWLLKELNQVGNQLVIGVDEFSVNDCNLFTVSDIALFDAVLENKNLKFVFYNLPFKRNLDVLNIPYISANQIGNPKGYFEGDTKEEKCLNSMIELRNILQNADEENAITYAQILDIFHLNKKISNDCLQHIINKSMNIYDNSEKMFLFPTTIHYEMGYSLENGGMYVRFNKTNRIFNTSQRFVLVSTQTRLMLNEIVLTSIKHISLYKFKVPNILWYDGVPGSGKSEMIVLQHDPKRDLVLSETKANINNIRERVLKKHGKSVERLIKWNYRTVCSYVINYHVGRNKYQKVYIDEAIAMHSGYLGFIFKLSKASELIIFGDSKQIPYIERSPINCVWSDVFDICIERKFVNISKRCPIDVCYALSDHYKRIATDNKVVKSISSVVREIKYDQIEPNTLVLTFTQKEKYTVMYSLKYHENVSVLTVHEAQGSTFENVVLIRLVEGNNSLFHSTPHSIVALSRHTKTFKYFTLGECDAVETLINKVKEIRDIDLIEWNLAQKDNLCEK